MVRIAAVFLSLLFLSISNVYAKDLSFRQAKKALVALYQANPDQKTFYCGCEIGWKGRKGVPQASSCGYTPRIAITRSGKKNARAERIEWEHVMPAYWFGHQMQCWQEGGRKACKKDPLFHAMEGDLHNLQPTIGELNGDRSNYRFAQLSSPTKKYGQCDFAVDFKDKKAQPPAEKRGDIARTYFYMADRYKLKLSKSQRRLFEAWAKTDPVDAWELRRNQLITEITGVGNPFIVLDSVQGKLAQQD